MACVWFCGVLFVFCVVAAIQALIRGFVHGVKQSQRQEQGLPPEPYQPVELFAPDNKIGEWWLV